MTTIKRYTDLGQSRKLAEILSHESADMVYFGIHQGMDGKYYLSGTNTEDDVIPIYKNFCIKVFAKTTASDVINQLPCWSLSALLSLMICPNLEEYIKDIWNLTTFTNETLKTPIEVQDCKNPIDACYELILKLNELNLL